MMRGALAAAALAALVAVPAKSETEAEILLSCGPFEGHVYTLKSPALGEDTYGWAAESYDSPLLFVRTADGYDIVTGDTSLREFGAVIATLSEHPGRVALTATWPGIAVHVYVFDLETPEMIVSETQARELMQAAATYRAPCSRP